MAEPAAVSVLVPAPRRITPPRVFAALLLIGLGLVPLWAHLADEPFLVTLFTRILIFALAAVGLNLVLGFGAMVSFGHAMYLGIGAYAVGILSFHGVDNGWLQLAAALAVGALVALAVGAIVLRTSGMAFIMITLAFAQMLYFLAVSLRDYGGDDGLPLNGRSDFGGIDLNDNTALYYLAYALLLAVLVAFGRLIDARFGMVLRGCKSNERRMATLGFPTLRYKLSAYVLSALVCVVAGMLMANLTRFIAPSYMAWTVSGELIVMTVLGGLGTLIGPVAGATALLLVEEAFSSLKLGVPWLDDIINQHWLALIGLFIVFVVLVLKQGVYGWLVVREQRREAAAAQAAAGEVR
jgi:branched-chain amino acid transport system permease protein